MANVVVIDEKKYKALIDQFRIEYPRLAAKMNTNVVANVAAEGRKAEMQSAHQLKMGQFQIKPKNGIYATKQFSRWDEHVGWVSTSRGAGNGKSGFRMGSFAWERSNRKKMTTTAAYTNQLANLWANETKPYSVDSPFVGRVGTSGRIWKAGQRRDSRYSWSTVESSMRNAISGAIKTTEAKFKERLEEIKQ